MRQLCLEAAKVNHFFFYNNCKLKYFRNLWGELTIKDVSAWGSGYLKVKGLVGLLIGFN